VHEALRCGIYVRTKRITIEGAFADAPNHDYGTDRCQVTRNPDSTSACLSLRSRLRECREASRADDQRDNQRAGHRRSGPACAWRRRAGREYRHERCVLGKDKWKRYLCHSSVTARTVRKHLNGRKRGYLFQTQNGTPLRLSNVLRDKLYPILRKLNLMQPGVGMHAFRRGRISHLVYSGVNRQVIRDWCGHSSDKMIHHYTKLLRQHHAPEMAKVKPLLDPSWTQMPAKHGEEVGAKPQPAVN
jgi:integrase